MVEANILLGGVPFGCDNVGDEAILASIVKLIKSELPSASIMACTDAPEETARLLGISCVPLYGFDRGCGSEQSFKNALAWADVFVWAGATGLSDYPEAGMRCMTLAQKCGVATMVFCTGMNDAINSAYVKLRPGLKKQLLQCFSALCANNFDFVRRKEARPSLSLQLSKFLS